MENIWKAQDYVHYYTTDPIIDSVQMMPDILDDTV